MQKDEKHEEQATRTDFEDLMTQMMFVELVKERKGENAESSSTPIFLIKNKYGTLSPKKISPTLTLIEWNGIERYDLRYWLEDGSPGKGITFTTIELMDLQQALNNFDYRVSKSKIIRQYKSGKYKATFYRHIVKLSSSTRNDVVWNKEVNLLDWGYGIKADIRKWTSDYSQCGRGISLTFDELRSLKILIDKIIIPIG